MGDWSGHGFGTNGAIPPIIT